MIKESKDSASIDLKSEGLHFFCKKADQPAKDSVRQHDLFFERNAATHWQCLYGILLDVRLVVASGDHAQNQSAVFLPFIDDKLHPAQAATGLLLNIQWRPDPTVLGSGVLELLKGDAPCQDFLRLCKIWPDFFWGGVDFDRFLDFHCDSLSPLVERQQDDAKMPLPFSNSTIQIF